MNFATFRRLFWPVTIICAAVFVIAFYFGVYVADQTLANIHQTRCGANCSVICP